MHPGFMPHGNFEYLGQNWRNRKENWVITKSIYGPKKMFKDFLQKMTSAINIMILNSKAREIIIESLAW